MFFRQYNKHEYYDNFYNLQVAMVFCIFSLGIGNLNNRFSVKTFKKHINITL